MSGQLRLTAKRTRLPIRPAELRDLEPLERGRLYAELDLHSTQIACVEEARRMALAGSYPATEREAS